jgi:Flp pilus assembly protein TadG
VRRHRGEAGGATVELTLLTPLLLLFLVLVVGLGRLGEARSQVDGAARDAARAASLARSPASAAAAARESVSASLAGGGASRRAQQTTPTTSAFRPGGWVAVTVTCTADLTDVAELRLPGSETIRARFVEPIDLYRAVTP